MIRSFFPGRDVKCPQAEEIVYTLKDRQYFEHIERAYNYASKLLLDLLMDEKELVARLKYVHIIYLFMHFMHIFLSS